MSDREDESAGATGRPCRSWSGPRPARPGHARPDPRAARARPRARAERCTSTPRSAWADTQRACSSASPVRPSSASTATARRWPSSASGSPASETASGRSTPSTTRSRTSCAELDLTAVDGILFDLGVSSLQLDETDRGFAYRVDAPLDMRMDQSTGMTAADVLNTYSRRRPHPDPARLRRGALRPQDRHGRRARPRQVEPFTTSGRLVELLRRVIPMASQRQSGHPAKRTFQALRIEVNDELEVWRRAIDRRDRRRSPSVGGSRCCPTTPSRTARRSSAFAAGATSSTPPGLPVELPEHAAYLSLVTRGGRGARRRRGRPQPPRRLGPPAGRRAGAGHGPRGSTRSTSRPSRTTKSTTSRKGTTR